MRDLIRFLGRFHAFFLFIVLEIVAYLLIVNTSQYHRAGFFNTANNINSSLFTSMHNVGQYFNLTAVNDSLVIENAELRSNLNNAYAENLYYHGQILDTLNSGIIQQFEYMPAQVISKTTTNSRNYIFIDKGRKQGVEEGMGIMSKNGVAGVVVSVSRNASVAMSLLHIESRISCKLDKSHYFGSLIWDGKSSDQALVMDIPFHVATNVGDSISTSGYSFIFPSDIHIATIVESRIIEGTNYQEIKVNLATNFSNLQYVYVVKNFFSTELTELMESVDAE